MNDAECAAPREAEILSPATCYITCVLLKATQGLIRFGVFLAKTANVLF